MASSYLDDDSVSIDSADLDDVSSSSDSSDDSDVIVGGTRGMDDYGSFKKGPADKDTAERMSQLLELRHQLGMDKDIEFLREEKKVERTKSCGSSSSSLGCHISSPLSPGRKLGSPKLSGQKKSAAGAKETDGGTLQAIADQAKLDIKKKREKEKAKEAERLKQIQAERERITAEREEKEEVERRRKEAEEKKKKEEEEARRRKEEEQRQAEKDRREAAARRRKEEVEERLRKAKAEKEERLRKEMQAAEERRRKEEEERRLAAEQAKREREEAERNKLSTEEQRKLWQKEMEDNARKALEAAAAKKAAEEAAALAGGDEDNVGGPYYTHKQLTEKSVPGLDYKNREIYLKPSEFKRLFGVTKDEFKEWPAWKQTRLKRTNQLLT